MYASPSITTGGNHIGSDTHAFSHSGVISSGAFVSSRCFVKL